MKIPNKNNSGPSKATGGKPAGDTRLLVVSDTHGNHAALLLAIAEAGPVDAIIHLGDELGDIAVIERNSTPPVIKIAGNCDIGATAPRDLNHCFAETRTFLTHGDRYNVKLGLAKLHKKALQEKAELVLYGHTHRAAIENVGGITYINPGCLTSTSSAPSYAVVTVASGNISARIVPCTY